MKPFMKFLNPLIQFTNHCSNEKVPKMKVVDIKKLNKNGIQKFFIRGQEEREKVSL
jgi:hypothetical protein